jgi:hypothetical protein
MKNRIIPIVAGLVIGFSAGHFVKSRVPATHVPTDEDIRLQRKLEALQTLYELEKSNHELDRRNNYHTCAP